MAMCFRVSLVTDPVFGLIIPMYFVLKPLLFGWVVAAGGAEKIFEQGVVPSVRRVEDACKDIVDRRT